MNNQRANDLPEKQVRPEVQGLPRVFLKPGECAITSTPTVISTVLGSCVSVTMYVPRLSLGAICHALLPTQAMSDNPLRYVDSVIPAMVERLLSRGVCRDELVVKVFGGGDVIDTLSRTSVSVGSANIEAVLRVLAREGLSPASSDTGGKQGRKLIFYSHTGEVFLKRLVRSGKLNTA